MLDRGTQCFERERPHRGLAREHHCIGAVDDGVGHVAGLGAGGPGCLDHRLEHLRGHDAGLAGHQRRANQVLLRERHLLEGQLHAEVAARDHDAVGDLEDLIDVLERRLCLDLGHDADVVGEA